MHALDDATTSRLLDLLREAGETPVTLDELAVVGVEDPAQALLDLELAGHAVSRVLDDRVECVRLAPFDGVHLLAEPEPWVEEPAVAAVTEEPVAPEACEVEPGPGGGSRRMLAAVALLLLALLLSRR